MQSVSYPLEFTNTSPSACILYGYPGVSARSGTQQLGSPAQRGPYPAPQTVTLAPHATANAVLTIIDVGIFPSGQCHPAGLQTLKVYPPDQYTATYAPADGLGCASPGPIYLKIGAIQPGVGVPGQG
jgi:hypothetical protein